MNSLATVVTLCTVCLVLLLHGCDQPQTPSDPVPSDLMLVGTSQVGTLRIEAYATEALHVGMNRISYKITRGGAAINDIDVSVKPICLINGIVLSSPCEDPSQTPDESGLYVCETIFTVPSDTSWSMHIDVRDEKQNVTTPVIVRVRVLPESNVLMYTLPDGSSMLLTLVPPSTWRVGMNDVTLMLHATFDGMQYASADNIALKLTPSMPSMGHGSHGNVDPTSLGKGLYKGAANLIMSGEWALDVELIHEAVSAGSVRFMIMVP